MSKAIDDLKSEHDAILSGLQILDAITSRINRGLEVDKKSVHDFMGFLKEFADKCHHGKEEGILFPAMAKGGITDMAPIKEMLAEHARARELIRNMDSAFAGKLDYAGFARAAEGYKALMQTHIEKENGALLRTADTTLGEAQLSQLSEAFAQHEQKAIGSGRHEELHSMLKALRQKYFI